MTEENRLDPTAFGMFIVAAIMMPLIFQDLWDDNKAAADIGGIFLFGGILLALVTIWCWKCKANFGFCVFGIAAFGVFMTGHCQHEGAVLGAFFNLGMAVMFLMFTYLSFVLKTPKLLSVVILMTALVFLFGGIAGLVDGDTVDTMIKIQGVVSAINFIAQFWLGSALISDGKIPSF